MLEEFRFVRIPHLGIDLIDVQTGLADYLGGSLDADCFQIFRKAHFGVS